MAQITSETVVGNVTQAILQTVTPNAEQMETSIITATGNLRMKEDYQISGINNMFRQLAEISANTYQDTILITRVSVNEVMAG